MPGLTESVKLAEKKNLLHFKIFSVMLEMEHVSKTQKELQREFEAATIEVKSGMDQRPLTRECFPLSEI